MKQPMFLHHRVPVTNPRITPLRLMGTYVGLMVTLLFLLGLQPPPPTTTGDGEIEVSLTAATGQPLAGVQVRYLDEWQGQPYGDCITDAEGKCLLTVQGAPALHTSLRGALEVDGYGQRPVILLVGERIKIPLTLDANGQVSVATDVLATRDLQTTPTLFSPTDAFATLTAVGSEGLATPSPGIELTIAAAHAAMAATTTAREGRVTLTVTPLATKTPFASETPVLAGTGTITPAPDHATPPVVAQINPQATAEIASVSVPTIATEAKGVTRFRLSLSVGIVGVIAIAALALYHRNKGGSA